MTQNKLIHPDGIHPAHDFEGWLDTLIDQAQQADVSDDVLVEKMQRKVTELEDSTA